MIINPENAFPGSKRPVQIPDGLSSEPLGSGVITRMLGVGGMANVYEIWNTELEIHRAVKLLHPSCSQESVERFQTETKITAKLHHPNIVEIHTVGKWKGLPYIEMERAEGQSLEELIMKHGALPAHIAVAAGIKICGALAFAHKQEYMLYGKKHHGVVHRDLKPSNIMICKSGVVKLMDFGIARPIDASYHTIDGTVIGTLQYLSPEQLEGKPLDERTDIYSLGVTLYEALCGEKAFGEPNMSRLMADRKRNRFTPLHSFAISAPKGLLKTVQICMHKDPSKRYASADALRIRLESIARDMGLDDLETVLRDYVCIQSAERSSAPQRRSRIKCAVAIAATVCVAVIAGAFAFTYTGQRAARERSRMSVDVPKDTAHEPVTRDETGRDGAPGASSAPRRPANRAAPRQSAAPAPAAVKPKQPSASPQSALDTLLAATETSDLNSLAASLHADERHTAALLVFDSLVARNQATDRTRIFALRSARALDSPQRLDAFLAKYPFSDAEYLLARASRAYEKGRLDKATRLLDQAQSAPRAIAGYETMALEIAYLRARCARGAFDTDPGDSTYHQALADLRQLRALLQSNRDHPYYQFAREQAQRIGLAYQSIQEQP